MNANRLNNLWFSTRIMLFAVLCGIPFVTVCILLFTGGLGSTMAAIVLAGLAIACGIPAILIGRSIAAGGDDCRAKLESLYKVCQVVEFDLDANVIAANDLVVRDLGFSDVNQVIGLHHRNFIDSAFANSLAYSEFWARLRRGEAIEERGKRIGTGGKEIWIIANYSPIIGPSGKPYKVVVWSTDYTEAHREQAVVVDALAHSLQKMSGGDLTVTLNNTFGNEYETLRKDFNTTLTHLQETMKSVLNSASSITTGAGEISQAADDLSHRTEQQAASLEETAAALEEITATVKKTAENAKEVTLNVEGATVAAQDCGRVVETAVKAMDAIAQSSKQITDIIGVIDEIAFQTNLLALNAGVEAARAGEAGKGFAVVASEVRALAQRSSEAAKQIKTLIKTSGEHVEDGVRFVGETGQALQRIVDKAAKIDVLVKEMEKATEQQSTGIEQVNAAVGQMDQVTQQNAAMVEESTAAARNLAGETRGLTELVGFFSVGENFRPAAPQLVKTAPVKAAPVKAAPPRPHALPSRAGGKRAALASAVQSEPDNDWTEF